MLYYELFESECENSRYVVLLHGFGGNHRIWKNQIPLLQERYHVLAIDLPSHVENNIKLSQMEISLDSVVKEIIQVLESLSVKKAIFMGVSLGTIFIKYMEVFYNKYIEKAILVGAVGNVGTFLRAIVSIFSSIGDKLPFPIVYKIFSKVLMPLKISKKSRHVFCKCAKILNRIEFRAYMQILKEHISFVQSYVKDVHEQNVYISGQSDLCFIKEVKEEANDTQGEFIEIKNCGHVCNIDQQNIFNNILSDQLKLSYVSEDVVEEANADTTTGVCALN